MKKLTLEEKLQRATNGSTPTSELVAKITKLIEENLDEALNSKSEYIRQKAEQMRG